MALYIPFKQDFSLLSLLFSSLPSLFWIRQKSATVIQPSAVGYTVKGHSVLYGLSKSWLIFSQKLSLSLWDLANLCNEFPCANLCILPPERAATSHTPDRSLIASRTCVCPRGRSLAAAACVWGPEQYSSWNTCCPGLLTLVNLREKKRRQTKVWATRQHG